MTTEPMPSMGLDEPMVVFFEIPAVYVRRTICAAIDTCMVAMDAGDLERLIREFPRLLPAIQGSGCQDQCDLDVLMDVLAQRFTDFQWEHWPEIGVESPDWPAFITAYNRGIAEAQQHQEGAFAIVLENRCG